MNESCSTDCPCHAIETATHEAIGLIAESIYSHLGVAVGRLPGEKIEKELDFHLDPEYYTESGCRLRRRITYHLASHLDDENYQESDHNELLRLLIYGKLRGAIREIVEITVSEFNLEPWEFSTFSEELHSKFRLREVVEKLGKTLKS